MRRGAHALWLVCGLGCGAALEPGEIADIDGAWSYSESALRESPEAACSSFGTISFKQDAETFVGSFTRGETCTGGAGNTVTTQSGQVSGGQVVEGTIRFRMQSCDYRGVLDRDQDPDRMGGSLLCTRIGPAGIVTTGTGTWQAERIRTAAASR